MVQKVNGDENDDFQVKRRCTVKKIYQWVLVPPCTIDAFDMCKLNSTVLCMYSYTLGYHIYSKHYRKFQRKLLTVWKQLVNILL